MLWDFSKDLGSDVPLFVSGREFSLRQRQGRVAFSDPRTKNLKLWHILVTPGFKVSTPYAYSLFDSYFSGKRAFPE